jgi:hypothetical protein
MIVAADAPIAPVRVVLGSDAYAVIKAGLTARLEQVEAQAAVAPHTDLRAAGE